MDCVMRATESGKVWKALSKGYAPGKYHLNYILTFHLRNIYIDFGTFFEIQPNRKQTDKKCQVAVIWHC